jgi:hypothetical protein
LIAKSFPSQPALALLYADLTTLSNIFAAFFGKTAKVFKASWAVFHFINFAINDIFLSDTKAYFNVAVRLLFIFLDI